MGTVPVAPNSKRLRLSGANRDSGFMEKPGRPGLNKIVRKYMAMFAIIIDRTGSSNFRRFIRLLNHEPGREIPQYGQIGSSLLMSFRQLGQRIDLREESVIGYCSFNIFLITKGKIPPFLKYSISISVSSRAMASKTISFPSSLTAFI